MPVEQPDRTRSMSIKEQKHFNVLIFNITDKISNAVFSFLIHRRSF